jgi:hypothetical protein
MTKLFWGNGSEVLHCQIPMDAVEYGFVVKQSVLAMLRRLFGARKVMVAEEVNFIVTDLTSKVCTILLSHAPCNGKTGIETGPLAIGIVAESLSDLHILSDCSKLHYHFNASCCSVPCSSTSNQSRLGPSETGTSELLMSSEPCCVSS